MFIFARIIYVTAIVARLFILRNQSSSFFSADDGVRVHFELSFEPIFTAVSTTEVTAVLTRELESPTVYLDYVTALPETLHIEVTTI